MANVIVGKLNASNTKFAIVVARFNSFVTKPLLEGAVDTIVQHGGDEKDITVVHVPGSFEIPIACKSLAESKKYDAIITIGAVIRGDTDHYDYVCQNAISGISQISLETSTPILLGIITTNTIEQAIERSGSKAGNKGSDAAIAAIEMVQVMRGISGEANKLKKVAG
ncbi:MAG: 6,7-dimethyl-8-ribityllumazine synthase [Deltaproteobacteria bacterium]|nr:6,7-dimethyl-8-ribityllumazine synthase [Deltaproteobacteria bacterium]